MTFKNIMSGQFTRKQWLLLLAYAYFVINSGLVLNNACVCIKYCTIEKYISTTILHKCTLWMTYKLEAEVSTPRVATTLELQKLGFESHDFIQLSDSSFYTFTMGSFSVQGIW